MDSASDRVAVVSDTIVAISTPPGRGGIGIVRLSGPEARAIAEGLVRLKRPLEAGRARFGQVVELAVGAEMGGGLETHVSESRHAAPGLVAEGVVLDEAVVTWFAGPRSYTGEDVVEIAAHGSPVVLEYLLRRCVGAGARLAEPGEFTERAFLSGRLDLTQAEAVRGLIEATTLQQARTAAMQLGGGLSRLVGPVKRELIELIAALEAGIDFAEDDLDLMADAEIARRMREIAGPLMKLEKSFGYGRVLREGFRLAIVGRPNAGKSSLFNRLVGRDRSIVTASPGTTRDTVAERLELAGIPVELVDTAGLRNASSSGAALDEAEGMGVARSREAMAEADVVVLVVAANAELHEEDRAVMAGAVGRRLILVVNKVDLVGASEAVEALVRECGGKSRSFDFANHDEAVIRFAQDDSSGEGRDGAVIATSAVVGTGIEELRGAILAAVQAVPGSADTVTVTSLRQQEAIAAGLAAVRLAEFGLGQGMPHEMLLLDLHEGLGALDALTGTTHTEEILGVIFGSFCIGK